MPSLSTNRPGCCGQRPDGGVPPRINGRLFEAARQLVTVQAADDADEGRLQAELLYAQAAGWDRVRVLAAGAAVPEPPVLARFEALLERRLGHEPLAYILGQREFYGLTLEIGPGVLVPRPETETLVEAALAAAREHPNARRVVRIVDAGTGSGAVALALARQLPNAQIYAIDSSSAALEYAGRNRDQLGLRDRVVLLTGDLLDPLPERVDIAVANLPYIPTSEAEALPETIRLHEPWLAIDGGEDGFAIYRRFFAMLPAHLVEGPHAALIEVGAGQASHGAELLRAAAGGQSRTHRDLAGIRRVVEVRTGY